MDTYDDFQDPVSAIIRRYFAIDSIAAGKSSDPFLWRFTGRLLSKDSEAVFDTLTGLLQVYNLAPLFRVESGMQVVYVIKEPPRQNTGRRMVNLLLFGLTILSVLISGALYSYQGTLDGDTGNIISELWANLKSGIPFAASLLLILSAHELGHYFAGRYHKVKVTLPYFIPLPLSTFGTMGAFIQIKSVPKNRKQLLDIAVAGPLAGLLVTIPLLIIGLSLSEIGTIPAVLNDSPSIQLEGNSILYLLMKQLVFNRWLPEPAFYATPQLLHWAKYYLTGTPLPLGGLDVMLHPVAWAGWAGLLVTSLNLIPAGQLDGGHILFGLFGSNGSRKVLPLVLLLLAALGFVWNGWWMWVVLILVFGRSQTQLLDQITPLDTKRKVLGLVMLIVFILVFIPVPLTIV